MSIDDFLYEYYEGNFEAAPRNDFFAMIDGCCLRCPHSSPGCWCGKCNCKRCSWYEPRNWREPCDLVHQWRDWRRKKQHATSVTRVGLEKIQAIFEDAENKNVEENEDIEATERVNNQNNHLLPGENYSKVGGVGKKGVQVVRCDDGCSEKENYDDVFEENGGDNE